MVGKDPALWSELMKVGKTAESERQGITHSMTTEQLYNILGTIDDIGPAQGVPDPQRLNLQWSADMSPEGAPVHITDVNKGKSFIRSLAPRYRLFDEIGMAMGGRLGEDEDTIEWANKLAKAYIACVKEKQVKTRKELYDCIPDMAYEIHKRERQ